MSNIVSKQEEIIYQLKKIYNRYGYQQYKMNKFEEYDLYSQNKDFLISDTIITFTDTNGKLLALKPDVTLSIVRNMRNVDGIQKVFYNENVYRVSKFSKMFKEITQVGVECIGDVDNYVIIETLMLALKSLSVISEQYKISISHLDILEELLDRITEDNEKKKQILQCIDQKNLHELAKLELTKQQLEIINYLMNSNHNPQQICSYLQQNNFNQCAINQLKEIFDILAKNGYEDKIELDFSIVSNTKYYNGIAFKGFIQGVPTRVLAGGQYDNLMRKMKRKSKAIGFAVYLDMLDRFDNEKSEFDYDVLVLYQECDENSRINEVVQKLINEGKTVMASKRIPQTLKFKQCICLNELEG